MSDPTLFTYSLSALDRQGNSLADGLSFDHLIYLQYVHLYYQCHALALAIDSTTPEIYI